MSISTKSASFRAILFGGAAFLSVTATSVYAQSADTIETIVVTAEKRATDAQTTPIAMQIFTGQQLTAQGINSTSDLQFHTPDLMISSNTLQGEVYIRGIGTDIASIGADPSVAVLLDGVYLPRLSTSLQDLYDVARVEVLKGPQGTLYGRNATGGVINIVSELPTDAFEVKADALYGNYNQQRYRFSISGTLADNLTGRFTFVSHSDDGFVKNLYTGGRINRLDDMAGRGMLRWQPSSKLDITLSADLSNDSGNPSTSVRVLSNDAPQVVFFGGLVASNPFNTYENFPELTLDQQGGVTGKIVWDEGDFLFTSISAYRFSRFHVLFDSDGTNIDWVNLQAHQNSKTASQEFQFASKPGSPLDWIFGLYYFNENANSNYFVAAPIVGETLQPLATNTTNAYAAYAEATYHVTDKFLLTAGARYSDETKDATLVEYISGASAGSFDGGKTWTAFTPKFVAQYFPTDQVMLFASATRGFKSGGFSSTAIQNPPGFSPEYVWSYEAGLKSTFLDQRLRLNASAFYYDYNNLQVNVYNALTITTIENAAKATIKGLELEADAVPVDGLTLSANSAFLDPTYDNYETVNPDFPGSSPVNLKGNTMVRAPRMTYTLSGEYTHPLADVGDLTGRLEYSYRSRTYFTPFDAPGVSQAGFGLWNARLTYAPANSIWSVAAFINNISNQVYYQEEARTAGLVGTIGWVGDPRTFGVEVAVHN